MYYRTSVISHRIRLDNVAVHPIITVPAASGFYARAD